MATFDTLSLDTLNGRNGFSVNHWKQFFANRVSSAGDVNGDGIDDLFIGQWHASNRGVSTTYVVFGSEQPFAASMGSGSLDGANGFYLRGAETADYAGAAVASAGDVNGDGIDDLILGAPWASVDGQARAGGSYVVFGSDAGFPAWFSLADLDGSNGFHLAGDTENGFAGYAVSSAGDVNNDGVDDLLIGVPNSLGSPDENETTPGETYVVFGSTTGFPASLALTDMDGQSGFRLLGTHPLDKSGFSVASAGDVNGDGIGDIIVGAPGTDPNGTPDVGESFVVFGSDAGFPETVSASDLDGTNGFRVRGTFGTGQSGFSVSTAGDFNGDGFDDLIIGAQYAGLRRGDQRGESYIVFGTDAGFPETLSAFDLDGGNGFRFVGRTPEDYLGFSVAAAGDVNGDGFDDVIVGAPGADNGGVSQAGESYVLLGPRQDLRLCLRRMI